MDTVLIAIFTFVPMLLVLVVVHEFGHFLTAKAFGVKVLEFGVGYPPKAWGFYTGRTTVLLDQDTVLVNASGWGDLSRGQLVKVQSAEDANGNLVARVIEVPRKGRGAKGPQSLQESGRDLYLNHEGKIREVSGNSVVLADMLYSLNWAPLGGFVRLAGENNPNVPKSLANRGVGQRAVVLAAGSFMNAIFPIVAFTLLFMVPQDIPIGDVVVDAVATGSPAEVAGLQTGDIIIQAQGKQIETQADLFRTVTRYAGAELELLVGRGSQTEVFLVTPRQNPPQGEGPTGITIGLTNTRVETRSAPPWTAFSMAVSSTWEMLVLLKLEISGWISGDRAPQLSGPIGIAQITGEVTAQGGLRGWVILAILLSINLAILNILPIPMLDGGRLLFVGIEWVRGGKRVPPEKEGLVHLIGFAALVGLIILISANDIYRLIQGGSPLGG